MATRLCNENLAALEHVRTALSLDRTDLSPSIAHIGVGNFFRAHLALYTQDAVAKTGEGGGIIGFNTIESDVTARLRQALNSQNGLYTVLHRDSGNVRAELCETLLDVRHAGIDVADTLRRLIDPKIKAVTLTITEGGYYSQGIEHDKVILQDLEDPSQPRSVPGIIVEALRRRFDEGTAPFVVISCDNLVGNGDIAKAMIVHYAMMVDAKLAARIQNEVQFPNSMVDRITPQSSPADIEYCREKLGVEDQATVSCEPFRQWVIENDGAFAGLPRWDVAGAQFVSDVRPYELAKLRLLNAGHSLLGYAGFLGGHTYIHEIAMDPRYAEYLARTLHNEVKPFVEVPSDFDKDAYIDTVISRFCNEEIRDQALRICSDGSSKIPKFILPSIRLALDHGASFNGLSVCVASWIRFLAGIDENGNSMDVQDPNAGALQPRAMRALDARDASIFIKGCDLFGDLRESENFKSVVQRSFDAVIDLGAARAIEVIR